MEIEEIEKLLELFENSGLSEMEIVKEGLRIVFRRGQLVSEEREEKEEKPAPIAPRETETTAVLSPVLGVFYRRPNPESEPFVEEGAKVEKGQILGIVEAMKTFTEIKAPADGTITEILVKDGQKVEYDQKLMILRKGG